MRRQRPMLIVTIFMIVTIFALVVGSGLWTKAQQRKPGAAVVRPPTARAESNAASSHELWVSIFPVGVRIHGLWTDVSDANVVYAATHRGLFKASRGGMYWSPVFVQDMEFLTFSQCRSSPGVMYLGGTLRPSRQSLVWKSEDRGLTWHVVGSGVLNSEVNQISIDPNNPLIAYVISGGELLKTVNGGNSWGNITPRLSFDVRGGCPMSACEIRGPIKFVAIDPANTSHVLAGGQRTGEKVPDVLESMDGGISWTLKDFARPSQSFENEGYHDVESDMWATLIYHRDNGEILAGLNYPVGNHYSHLPAPVISTDGGRSWKFIPGSMEQRADRASYSFAFSGAPREAIYVGTMLGLLGSSDRGLTWGKILPNAIGEVGVGGPNEIYAASDRGLLKSPDGGTTWHEATLGLPTEAVDTETIAGRLRDRPFQAFDEGFSTSVRKLVWVDGARNAIYVGGRGGYWTSSTGGLTWDWHPVRTEDGENIRQIVTAGDGTVYLNRVGQGAFATGGSEIIKVDPLGKSSKMRLDKSPRMLALSPGEPQVLYLTARELQDAGWAFSPLAGTVLLRSDDAGFSWAAMDLMRWLPANLRSYRISALPMIAVSPESSRVVYILAVISEGGGGGKREWALLATTDGGARWQDLSAPLQAAMRRKTPSGSPDPITAVAVDSNNPQIVYVTTLGGVFRSGDGGKIWTPLDTAQLKGRITDIVVSPSTSHVLYVASDLGVWRSSDSGRTWQPLSRGLLNDAIFKLIASPSAIFAQGMNGIYRLSDDGLGWAVDQWQQLEKGGRPPLPPKSGLSPPPAATTATKAAAPRTSVCGDYLDCTRRGNAYLTSNQPAEAQEMWDKALQAGGELTFPACHERSLWCDEGSLRLSSAEVSFERKGQKLFAVPPSQVAPQGVTEGSFVPYVSFGLRITKKKYKFHPFPFGIQCEHPGAYVKCPDAGARQQLAIADYVSQAIPKLASGALAKPEPPAPATASESASPPASVTPQAGTPRVVSESAPPVKAGAYADPEDPANVYLSLGSDGTLIYGTPDGSLVGRYRVERDKVTVFMKEHLTDAGGVVPVVPGAKGDFQLGIQPNGLRELDQPRVYVKIEYLPEAIADKLKVFTPTSASPEARAASRLTANERIVVGCLWTISTALTIFDLRKQTSGASGHAASLSELGNAGLIDASLASGIRNGYRFAYSLGPKQYGSETYTIHADPVTPGVSGVEHFFTDSMGAMRHNRSRQGGPNDEQLPAPPFM